MKVTIVIEDMPQGIYPVVAWVENGVTDHMSDSLSMALAAQFATLVKRSAAVGALKVVDPGKNSH